MTRHAAAAKAVFRQKARFSLSFVIEPDEIFGWSAVTEPFTFTAAAWTLEPSELLVLNGKVLLDLFKKNNHIGYKIMMKIASVISSRLKHLSQKLADSQ